MTPPRGNYFAAFPASLPEDSLEELRLNAPPRLRWFHPEDLHLTIAFLGPENSSRIPALLDILDDIPPPPQTITLGPLMALPTRRRPTACSFALAKGNTTVTSLMQEWRPYLLKLAGRPPDEREPLPHLTVARPPRRGGNTKELLEWLGGVKPPTAPVALAPPVLYGWSSNRPRRQFRIIAS